MTVEFFTLPMREGELLEEPLPRHTLGRDRLSVISPDPGDPGGLARQEAARNDAGRYLLDDRFGTGVAVEFQGGAPERPSFDAFWYGVVVAKTRNELVLAHYDTPQAALVASARDLGRPYREPLWRTGYAVRTAGHGPFVGTECYWAGDVGPNGVRQHPWITVDGMFRREDVDMRRPLTVIAAPVDAPPEEYAHLLAPDVAEG
jgi:hypothetical protein